MDVLIEKRLVESAIDCFRLVIKNETIPKDIEYIEGLIDRLNEEISEVTNLVGHL